MRISVSLRTKCSKKALYLSRLLWLRVELLMREGVVGMEYKEIKALIKQHFNEILDKDKALLDKHGSMNADTLDNITMQRDMLHIVLASDDDPISSVSLDDEQGVYHAEALRGVTDTSVYVEPFLDRYGLNKAQDSIEYKTVKSAYGLARLAYLNEYLKYHQSLFDYSLSPEASAWSDRDSKPIEKYPLSKVLEEYRKERAGELGDISERSLQEESTCLGYLKEYLGGEFDVAQIGTKQARELKDALKNTPSHRGKHKKTKGLALKEQIKVAKKHGLELITRTTVNKYIGYFNSFCKWASRNGYLASSPFQGMKLKESKKSAKKRNKFTDSEVRKIIEGLSFDEQRPSRYWGVLLAVYTGARRGEIAQLTPDDIMQDKSSGVSYINIAEEEEGKKIKSKAGIRYVPIHSALIELGFIEYVEKAKRICKARRKRGELAPRLLYDLKYSSHEGWGRSFGRWVNDRYLVELGIKTDKTSLHSLRHSFITNLSASDVEADTVQSIVGHEPQTVTHQSYTHLGVRHLPKFKDAIERLEY